MADKIVTNIDVKSFPNFEGFYGFRIIYNNGRKPESMWYLTEEQARRYAKRVERRKSVDECVLILKISDGSLKKMKPQKRRRRVLA